MYIHIYKSYHAQYTASSVHRHRGRTSGSYHWPYLPVFTTDSLLVSYCKPRDTAPAAYLRRRRGSARWGSPRGAAGGRAFRECPSREHTGPRPHTAAARPRRAERTRSRHTGTCLPAQPSCEIRWQAVDVRQARASGVLDFINLGKYNKFLVLKGNET